MRKIYVHASRLCLLVLFVAGVVKTAVANPAAQSGSTTYVATNGNNNNPGTLAAPFATIQHAVNHATPGDTIYVRGGTYHEVVTVRNSGTINSPITIAAYPGESPVIDGQFTLPPVPSYGWGGCNNTVSPPLCFHYDGMVWIRGDYVVLTGFEVRNSLGRGVVIYRKDESPKGVVVRDNVIHDLRSSALVMLESQEIVIEGNDIYHAGSYATFDRSSSTLNWPGAVFAVDSSKITYKNNIIHNNWGEGLSTGRGTVNVTIVDNILYDNFALNLYIHRSQNVNVSHNLIYCTNDPDFRRNGNPPSGLIINNETAFSDFETVENVLIVNNIFTGCRQHLATWSAGDERARHVMIAHNTFVKAVSNPGRDEAISISFSLGNYEDVEVSNNIFYQADHDTGWSAGSAGITFKNNLWSRTPHSSVQGAGDIVANPKLINANPTLQSGAVDPDWFMTQTGSPAIDAGLFVGQLTDYFKNERGLSPDIGGYEHPAGTIQLLEEKVFLPLAMGQ